MSALTWARQSDGRQFAADERGQFVVGRHASGRKYWGVTYPDGTYTSSAVTQAEAKLQAEAWRPDPSLVQLAGIPSAETDEPPAAAVVSEEPDSDAGVVRQSFLPDAGDDWQTAREKRENLQRYRRSALATIPSLVAARASLDRQIAEMVAAARTSSGSYYDYGVPTWAEIGKALGVTKQSAQAKYGKSSS